MTPFAEKWSSIDELEGRLRGPQNEVVGPKSRCGSQATEDYKTCTNSSLMTHVRHLTFGSLHGEAAEDRQQASSARNRELHVVVAILERIAVSGRVISRMAAPHWPDIQPRFDGFTFCKLHLVVGISKTGDAKLKPRWAALKRNTG